MKLPAADAKPNLLSEENEYLLELLLNQESNNRNKDTCHGSKYDEDIRDLPMEISKLLLSSTIEYIQNTAQMLQAFTGLILTSYLTLLLGFPNKFWLSNIPDVVYLAPIIFFLSSILFNLLDSLRYTGFNFVFGDLESTIEVYERVLSARRKQMILPSVFLALGVICLGCIAYYSL